ncbi:mitochondrial uncoupling protein 5-like [Musa acuminata AAA Group]|uniref:mitochondrial uncoupling protein 5-like n=1 Tax=Musa acuminata AAA Group TaxID=214697 RepID=UPI0031DEF91E
MGSKGFVEGGIASIAAGSTTHPLDLVKVRMQLQGEALSPAVSALRPAVVLQGEAGVAAVPHHHPALPPPPRRPGPFAVGAQILRAEGPVGLFSGVSATVLRQALYSTTRMGLYDLMKKRWSAPGDGGSLPLHRKVAAGLIAGGIGAVVGNPADVAMVRMQADGRLPQAKRRNYKSVLDAIGRMVRQEGVGSLWRGSSLTVNRAMIVTASQLATYDQAKEAILRRRGAGADGLGTHVTASLAAGLVAAAASNPVDVVKTRVMNMRAEAGAPLPYVGAVDCVLKTVRAEGLMALYKGFVPTVCRQGPFTVVLFVTLEQVRKLLENF